MNTGDFVSMTLSRAWGDVFSSVGWEGSVQIQKESADGNKVLIGSSVLGYSGYTVVAKIDAAFTTWAEGTNYTLTVKNVPTP